MTFTASWPNHETGAVTNDSDLKMFRQLEDGSWDQVASAATDNAGGPSETGIVDNPPAGHYKLRIENWASLDSDWTAQITFTQGTSSPGIPPSTESWKLECLVGSKVKATRQVTVARGQAVNVGRRLQEVEEVAASERAARGRRRRGGRRDVSPSR